MAVARIQDVEKRSAKSNERLQTIGPSRKI